jgi:hypothetical protein
MPPALPGGPAQWFRHTNFNGKRFLEFFKLCVYVSIPIGTAALITDEGVSVCLYVCVCVCVVPDVSPMTSPPCTPRAHPVDGPTMTYLESKWGHRWGAQRMRDMDLEAEQQAEFEFSIGKRDSPIPQGVDKPTERFESGIKNWNPPTKGGVNLIEGSGGRS